MVDRHVTLTGSYKGRNLVVDERDGGEELVLRKDDYPSERTSAKRIRVRLGVRRANPEEFDTHFGDLPVDREG